MVPPPITRKKVIWVPEGLYDFSDAEVEYLHRCRDEKDIEGDEFLRRPPKGLVPGVLRGRRDRNNFLGQRRDHLMDDTKSHENKFSYSTHYKHNTCEANSSDSEDESKYPEKESLRLQVHVMPNDEASSPVSSIRPYPSESHALAEDIKPSTSRRKLLIIPEPEIRDPHRVDWKDDDLNRNRNDDARKSSSKEDIPITQKIATFGRLLLSTMTPDPL